jgi:sec-independent protein translocase protein TatA
MLGARPATPHRSRGEGASLSTMFSGLESPAHWLVVIVIALLVFGPKRLPELGRSLGAGIRGFRASLDGEEEPPRKESAPAETPIPAAKAGER